MPGHILASDRSRYIGKFSGVSDRHTLCVLFSSLASLVARFLPKSKSIFRSVPRTYLTSTAS